MELFHRRRMVARVAVVLAAVWMLMLVAGFCSQAAPQRTLIGFSIYTRKAPFYAELVRSAVAYAKKFPNVEVVALDAEDSIERQMSHVEDLISMKCDIILMDPKDPVGLLPAADAVNRAGIPLIVVDTTLDPRGKRVTTIRADNFAIGYKVGQALGEHFGGKPVKAVIISGSVGDLDGQARREGFVAGFAEASLRLRSSLGLTILAQGWGGWTHQGGLKVMEDFLSAHKDIDLVFCENDSMGLGALKAAQESKRKLVVAGIDGEKGALEAIKKGEYFATGTNSPTILGQLAIETALKVLAGESVPEVIYTPAAVITKRNVDEYFDPASLF